MQPLNIACNIWKLLIYTPTIAFFVIDKRIYVSQGGSALVINVPRQRVHSAHCERCTTLLSPAVFITDKYGPFLVQAHTVGITVMSPPPCLCLMVHEDVKILGAIALSMILIDRCSRIHSSSRWLHCMQVPHLPQFLQAALHTANFAHTTMYMRNFP